MLLDLGDEYDVSKIQIWRRYSDSFNYTYADNFIYGLNNDREICYKFFDYRHEHQVTKYSENSGGRIFSIE